MFPKGKTLIRKIKASLNGLSNKWYVKLISKYIYMYTQY
jgi:hypothetical protein